MKISLLWCLDHLEHNLDKDFNCLIDFAKNLCTRFNVSIGEIESCLDVKFKFDLIRGNFKSNINGKTTYIIKNQEVIINIDLERDAWFVHDTCYRLANYKDINGSKDDILPEPCDNELGFNAAAFEDIIIEIDNKSLTHRSDLWSHYGLAREIGALYDWKLKPLDNIKIDISKAKTGSLEVRLDKNIESACKSFAVCQINNIKITPSPFWMLVRLARVGSRSINLPVDLTNYVMLDIGNPLHAFDYSSFLENIIEPRFATEKQSIKLLDEKNIELTSQDLIITNGKDPLALAGIMGGFNSGINNKTKSIVIEAAVFDPGIIRKSSVKHKIRTEASTRFEKGLDLNGNLMSIKQFITRLKYFQPEIELNEIALISNLKIQQIIKINFEKFKKTLAINITKIEVIKILNKLNFEVKDFDDELEVIVPSFRGSREFKHEADILEEIGRFIGFDRVNSSVPKLSLKGWDLSRHLRLRHIKDFSAYNGLMQEVSNYPLYDEAWLQDLKYEIPVGLKIINPVSEFRSKLITSLIPHLVQNIFNNRQEKKLRFFEIAPVWKLIKNKPVEVKKLSVIWLDEEANFYDFKNFWQSLFSSLNLDIKWQESKSQLVENFLFKQDSTAQLEFNNNIIGLIGYAAPFLELKIGKPFLIAEIDLDLIANYNIQAKIKPLFKFPISKLDVSIFILNNTVSELEQLIKKTNSLIISVELIDVMEKKEWGDQKSYTFRYQVTSNDRTLTKEDLILVQESVNKELLNIGAIIR